MEGVKERIACQYLLPLAHRMEVETLHSISLPVSQFDNARVCLGARRLQGQLREITRDDEE